VTGAGIQQSRISDLVRGKIDRFSMDTLVTLPEKPAATWRSR
jgi:predicted XRE-type DNA-binding protein